MYPAFVDAIRRERGLLTIDEIAGLVAAGNVVFDPFSVLVSASVEIGTGNVIYPCVQLTCTDGAGLSIGDGNIFHSNSLMAASAGEIVVGSSNQFGEGGFTARANRPGSAIVIADEGRYLGGASVFGRSTLGSGSQVLGAITVDGCVLEAGQSFRHPDPDRRAGLLKGAGIVKDLTVPAGSVIVGRSGSFSANDVERQSLHHPKG